MDSISTITDELLPSIEQNGCLLLRDVFDSSEIQKLCAQLDPLLENSQESASIRNRSGVVYAARNVLQLWPDVFRVCQQPLLKQFLETVLGTGCGLVRVLYFDKPPGQTWALPWHKDITIAVETPAVLPLLEGPSWSKVRIKAGVPHVEAAEETLAQMITLRVHLDPALTENGALSISPGSHRAGKSLDLNAPREMVIANAGDVFAMRPMLSHCSGQSATNTSLQRRILHLEFSASRELPHGFQWHEFQPVFP